MAVDKTLSQKYNEMIEILRELTDSMARIEERVEFTSISLEKLEKTFEKHVEEAVDWKDRIADLETEGGNISHSDIVTSLHDLKNRLTSVETTFKDFPHAEVVRDLQGIKNDLIPIKKVIEELEKADALNKIKKLDEAEQIRKDSHKDRWKTVGWLILNVAMNLIWVTIAAYLLYKFGLQGPPGGVPGVP